VSSARAALAEAARRASEDVALYRRDPGLLGCLPLGRFSEAGPRSLLLRRLALGITRVGRFVEWTASALSHRPGGKALELAAEVAYWRTARALLSETELASLARGPVILMYHAVGEAGERANRYIIPRKRFERQARWLQRHGYCLMTLRELVRSRHAGLPPPKTIVLTFDDGYRDNADVLLALGVPATIFVPTAYAGGRNEWDPDGSLRGRQLLGWEELAALRAAGVEIGGHSRTHPVLPDVPPERLEGEIRGALADLRRELGPGEYTFAYPHGRFNAQVQAALTAAGPKEDSRLIAAACSRGGVNDPCIPSFELRRVEIKGTDSFLSFVLMVELGRRITPRQLLRSLLFGG
jgi:peptidoglycan/xylan/chitin deacetylase (PgdA/CDA1 family)